MGSFLLRRLLHTLPVLLGVTFVVFISVYLLPGDVTQQLLGLFASEERAAELRRELGLDRNIFVQYFIWLGNLLQGDLGISHVMRVPVLTVVLERTGNSLLLMGASLLLVVLFSFVLGTTSAPRFRSPYDRVVVLLTLLLASMPTFWFGIVLLFMFGVHWPVFPMSGMENLANPGGLPDVLHHLVLPAVTTAATSIAIVTRVTRGALIDTMGQPYVLAARARGLARRNVIYRHAVRNVVPTFTNICGLQIGYLFGSAVFSEIVFAWPGIGLQLYESILARDTPIIQGCVLAVAIIFVFGNLLADTIVRFVDPMRDGS